MAAKRVLWGVSTGRTMRVHWALAELGLEYEIQPIQPRTGETLTPEYTALNPRQKIPLLQDGEFSLGESAAIVSYLAETYQDGSVKLCPDDPKDRFRWLEWSFFIVTELDSTSLYVMRRHGLIQGLAHIYGNAPEVVKQAAEYFLRQLRFASLTLDDGRVHLLGNQFTTVDILLTTCLTWARDYQIELDPVLVAYMERNTARAAYLAADLKNSARDPERLGC